MFNRVRNAFDCFIEVNDKSAEEIATLSKGIGIDIAVDLGGYTEGSRTAIFAYRAAPIQVSYIGYLGTMGAPFIDYLIADKTIIPDGYDAFYTEKIAYLPSYQINDRKKVVSTKQYCKNDIGIKDNDFVFCCFNNTYKINPAIFDSWMRILKAVDNSFLYLFAPNQLVESNYRKEAIKRGVNENRLIFGGIIPRAEYLARYQVADLFLDTNPYNAGTTASDALWVGLPVLSLKGESFSSRVAASLLTAMEMPELIVETSEEYEAKAIELASDTKKMLAIRKKLERNKLTSKLFDTEEFVKNLENIYKKMNNRRLQGLGPDSIMLD
jgi:predicted O-linked N-acetylglucosamine transferase (SPINDLY family)